VIRATVILIEFCAIADAGVIDCDQFPEPSGNLFATGTFCGYVDMAYVLDAASSSPRSDAEDDVPRELPSLN
jgi:hypothetical protein